MCSVRRASVGRACLHVPNTTPDLRSRTKGPCRFQQAHLDTTVMRATHFLLLARVAYAGHCYGNTACGSCVSDSRGGACSWCPSLNRCQMSYDSCSVAAMTSCVAGPPPPPLPGNGPFFSDASHRFATNPTQRNYGVAVTDTNADGTFEFVVAGFGAANQIFQWNATSRRYVDIAPPALQDASSSAIGVAACDMDGDGILFYLLEPWCQPPSGSC